MVDGPDLNHDDSQKKTLQGYVPVLATQADRKAAFDEAFDYRGDVTIRTDDGRVIEAYVFDRRSDATQPYVRVVERDSQQRMDIPYHTIAELTFSGRDTAAGKSWETWVKKYNEQRARGESASLEPEPLD